MATQRPFQKLLTVPMPRIGSFLVVPFLAMLTQGCSTDVFDKSILYTRSGDPAVTNGIAHDVVDVAIPADGTLILPEDAIVRRTKARGCRIYLKKKLDLSAHPHDSISIVTKREEMGCAAAREGHSTLISTFGEYELPGHGGASIELLAEVPNAHVVQRRRDLSGPKSLANRCFRRQRYSRRNSSDNGNDFDEGRLAWQKMTDRPCAASLASGVADASERK